MTVWKKNRMWSNLSGSIFAVIFLFFFMHLGYDVGTVVILAIANVLYISLSYFVINRHARAMDYESRFRWVVYVAYLLAFLILWDKLTLIGNIFLWASALIPVLCYSRLINFHQFLMTGLWYIAFASAYPILWFILFGIILFLRAFQLLTEKSLGRSA